MSIKSDLEYLLADDQNEVTEEEIDKLYYKYKTILEETNKDWQQLRKESES